MEDWCCLWFFVTIFFSVHPFGLRFISKNILGWYFPLNSLHLPIATILPFVKSTTHHLDNTHVNLSTHLLSIHPKLPTYLPAYLFKMIYWHTPKLFDRLKRESKMKTSEEQGVGNMFPGSQHFGGRRACWSSKMGLGKMTKNYSLTWTCTKPNNKLVSA